MNNRIFFALVPLMVLVMGIAACEDTADLENANQSPTYFNTLTRNGSAGVTTTELTLTFSSAINGLNKNDINLSGPAASGVDKGDLIHVSGGTYRLPVIGINSSGRITVTLSTRLNVTPSTRGVDVFFSGSPNGGSDKTLYIFNMSAFLNTLPSLHDRYDYLKLATALQGLANRDAPRIYFYFEDPESRFFYSAGPNTVDRFWLNHLSEGGRYLSTFTKNETKYPANAAGFLNLVKDFSDYYDGFVVWDTAVHATANVASTIAGADNLLPVPGNTPLYTYLIGSNSSGGFPLSSIRVNLVGKFSGTGTIPDSATPSTGSKKNDAYIWAKEQYLDTGKTNPLRMAYCTDSYMRGDNRLFWTTIANADFLIKEKAFFWDLSQNANGIPRDDQGPSTQAGEEVRTMNKLLASQAAQAGYQIFNVSGFTPWNIKYTTQVEIGYGGPEGTMSGVPAEWTLVNRLSRYGGQIEGDANAGVGDVSNLSVLSHVPLNPQHTQKNKGETLYNSITYSSNTSYFTIFMGDYDSASWTSSILSNFWENSKTGPNARGKYPLSWVIPTGISPRIPHLFNYLYEHATANDYFVAGDNGTAYLNPTMLESPHLAEGMPGGDTMLLRWEAYNKTLANRFDIQILPFFINTDVATLGTASIPGNVVGSMSRAYPLGLAYTATNGLAGNNNWNMYKHTNADNTVTPWIRFLDILGGTNGENGATPQQIANDIHSKINTRNGNAAGRRFYYFRCILVKPETINQALDILAGMNNMNYRVVDPYTLYRLAREN